MSYNQMKCNFQTSGQTNNCYDFMSPNKAGTDN